MALANSDGPKKTDFLDWATEFIKAGIPTSDASFYAAQFEKDSLTLSDIPHHWKAEIKKGLDRDVERGIIKPVVAFSLEVDICWLQIHQTIRRQLFTDRGGRL